MTNHAHKLKTTLDSSVAEFHYLKKDGEVRYAVGTRNINLIPSDLRPSSEIMDVNDSKAIVYYDFDECAFRSISVAANTY